MENKFIITLHTFVPLYSDLKSPSYPYATIFKVLEVLLKELGEKVETITQFK
jgi:hypothetical protein